MMGTFEVGQAVVLLDGTSLIGRIIKISETADAYKVSVNGSEGRWYEAAKIAATAHTDIAPADAPDAMVHDDFSGTTYPRHTGAGDPFTWVLPSDLATPEVKTVLKRLQGMLEEKGDKQAQTIATLQAENARLQAQVAAQRDCMAEMLGIMALSEGVSKEDFNRARELTQSK